MRVLRLKVLKVEVFVPIDYLKRASCYVVEVAEDIERRLN